MSTQTFGLASRPLLAQLRPRVRHVLIRSLTAISGLAVAVTLFMGVLHTRMGRPLLLKLFPRGCPIKASPNEVEASRERSVQALRGTTPAPVRPAYRFHLDETTFAEIQAWAKEHSLSCEDERADHIRCYDVASSWLGASSEWENATEVIYAFNPHDGKLVSLTIIRARLSAERGEQLTRAIDGKLRSILGQPQKTRGSWDRAALTQRDFASNSISYAYSDLLVDLVATNFPQKGIQIYESYKSAR